MTALVMNAAALAAAAAASAQSSRQSASSRDADDPVFGAGDGGDDRLSWDSDARSHNLKPLAVDAGVAKASNQPARTAPAPLGTVLADYAVPDKTRGAIEAVRQLPTSGPQGVNREFGVPSSLLASVLPGHAPLFHSVEAWSSESVRRNPCGVVRELACVDRWAFF